MTVRAGVTDPASIARLLGALRRPPIHPSPPEHARTRATRRAVADPSPTPAKPRPFVQRQRNLRPPSPPRWPRAAALPAMGR